jgi:hypothetical protein
MIEIREMDKQDSFDVQPTSCARGVCRSALTASISASLCAGDTRWRDENSPVSFVTSNSIENASRRCMLQLLLHCLRNSPQNPESGLGVLFFAVTQVAGRAIRATHGSANSFRLTGATSKFAAMVLLSHPQTVRCRAADWCEATLTSGNSQSVPQNRMNETGARRVGVFDLGFGESSVHEVVGAAPVADGSRGTIAPFCSSGLLSQCPCRCFNPCP